MKRKLVRYTLVIISICICLFVRTNSLQAQYVTHGPVIGAVTEQGAKIYVRTKQCGRIVLALSEYGVNSDQFTFGANTDSLLDKTAVLTLSGLKSDTRYYYRILFEGFEDSIKGSFRTFPESDAKGTYTFVTGSCQETENMKVFNVMPLHQPYFLLHTGDYTYPDYQIKPDYSNNFDTVAISYRKRYDEKEMKQMLYNIPIDYVYDDNDYVGGSGGRTCKNDMRSYKTSDGIVNEMLAPPFPAHWRENVIKGYDAFFPHYELPDTSEGIYHSFKLGNAEFFVLDRCSAKDFPNMQAFTYNTKKKKWVFDPPAGYSLFGKKQMDWLKASMLKSTADWKFIVSGVPLNGACKKLIDAGVKLQKLRYKNWYGFHLAWGFGQYWAAYPDERNDFMQFLNVNNLKNVIVISGDTHHNVMDDGKNAGLPELNASGLSVETTELARYLKLIGNVTGMYRIKKIWNKGGNGLSSKDSKNAFGKVVIRGQDYVELSIVDEDNHTVSSFKVPFKR